MAKSWFYKVMGEEVGPISSQELMDMAKNGMLGPDTLVRPSDSQSWRNATQVKGLFDSPAPHNHSMRQPIHVPDDVTPDFEEAVWWYQTPNSKIYKGFTAGPLSVSGLREAAKKRDLYPGCLVRHDSQDSWLTVNQCPWIFDISQSPPSGLPSRAVPTTDAQYHAANAQTHEIERQTPSKRGSLYGLADFARIVGGIGVAAALLSVMCALMMFSDKSSDKSQAALAVQVLLAGAAALISSLVWFIIAGSLLAFEHLIQTTESTAKTLASIDESLRSLEANREREE